MKIIADENIPLLDYYFGDCGQLVLKPGRAITKQDLLDADILLVRSVTHVNQELLDGTPVKFVGSATTGADHMDTEWLDKAGIKWSIATGCNAEAVAEYVVCTIAALQKMEYLSTPNLRAGVIGVGNVGKKVVEKLTVLGFDVVQCDPLRSENENEFNSVALKDLYDLDLISIHTPLIHNGPHPTFHLIEKNFLERQKKETIILNAGRGAVINFSDLKRHGQYLNWCLDVFENEPKVELDILGSTLMSTPHIAGYSVQAKYRGTEMLYQAACKMGVIPEREKTEIVFPTQTLSFANAHVDWRDVVLKIYDPMKTSHQMKEEMLSHHDTFDHLRKHFQERHEFLFVNIQYAQLTDDDAAMLKMLGIHQVTSVDRVAL
jgi:erythronate-4-phosphate dehydrogenase